MPCHHNNGHVTTVQELHLCKHHLDGHVTAQIHLPLLTATLVLQLEPGIDVAVSANIVVAAESAIQHANTPNDLLVLERNDSVFSSHWPHAVPNEIVSTITSETSTTTRHRDANTPTAGQSANEEHEVTTIAVATMVQPFKGTVNDTTVSSATGADDCNVGARLSSPRLHSETGPAQQGHRSPCQCTATGEFLWS